MEKENILIACVGITDPIRSDYDGPILHITRYYHPKKIYMILSSEIAERERKWKYNEEAVHLLVPKCEIIKIETGIEDPHSYDSLATEFRTICEQVKYENPGNRILLNITSGTPQMETTLAMIGMGEPEIYTLIQVTTPEKKSNHNQAFNPEKDDLNEWFEGDLDNIGTEPNRCLTPQLYNFRTPVIQFQIRSLIENYDYNGALMLYKLNQDILPEKLGILLCHGEKRLCLESEEAIKEARKCGLVKNLFLNGRRDIAELVDYFNSMYVKEKRGELNDFVMRLEVLAEYLGLFILEKKMKISVDQISSVRSKRKNATRFLNEQKCKECMPGIEEYFVQKYFFEEEKNRSFRWGNALNSRAVVNLVGYQSEKKEIYKKYAIHVDEMRKWLSLCARLRNPAAHTIVAITDEMFKKEYGGKSADVLCANIRKVMMAVFEKEVPKESFEVFDILNKMCVDCMRKV